MPAGVQFAHPYVLVDSGVSREKSCPSFVYSSSAFQCYPSVRQFVTPVPLPALFSARQVIYMAKPTLHEDRPAPQAQAQSIRDCQVRRGSRRAASFRAKSREATADPEDGGVLIPGMAVIIALNVTSQNVRKPPGDPRQTGWSDYWGGPPCPRQIPSSPSGPRRLGKRP